MDCVLLKGMTFYGYHGVHPEENRLGQRFELDIEASIDLSEAGASDDLDATVSYSDLFAIARKVVEGEPKNLIEAVAAEIASTALERFDRIQAITVEIRKPAAPIRTGGLDYAGVRIHQSRT